MMIQNGFMPDTAQVLRPDPEWSAQRYERKEVQ